MNHRPAVSPSAPISVAAGWTLAAAFVSLTLMSRCRCGSGPAWAAAALASAALIVVPAWFFARWTLERRCVNGRAVLHTVAYGVLMLGALPAMVHWVVGADWTAPDGRTSLVNKWLIQLLTGPGMLLIGAVQEFASSGEGTPMPDDPPRRLVTSGLYAYIANPMQVGKAGVLFAWAIFWASPWIAAIAVGGVLYSLVVSSPREDIQLRNRFGEAWMRYRQSVRRWRPRWRPYRPSSAQLYLDLDCRPCSELGAWFSDRRPAGLEILPLPIASAAVAAQMVYASVDAKPEYGMRALARGLEHLHLGWALCACLLRFPGIAQLTQLIADGVDARSAAACDARCESARPTP